MQPGQKRVKKINTKPIDKKKEALFECYKILFAKEHKK